jgi:iron complex outermembrane receptor protein
VDRATSNLKSLSLSTAYYNEKSSLRFNLFMGKESTYQAWYGIDAATLATDRKYNPAGTEKPGTPYDNQTDNFWQNHYQLFFNHTFNQQWSFNTAAFLTFGKGYYEEYKAEQSLSDYGISSINDISDLVRRRWLRNYFYGQIFSVQYKKNNNELSIGGGWSTYDGQHFGNVIWTNEVPVNSVEYYHYPALKADANMYVKWQKNLSPRWQSFVDMQYRYVYHGMNGFEGNPSLHVHRKFNFYNPKAGITYFFNGLKVYASYALGHKESNRDDFQAGITTQPKAETLHDVELGIEKKLQQYNFSANLYYMLYKDQLVLTGQINDVGAYPRMNVPNSYRLGIELQGGYVIAKWLQASANFSISRNKIKNFTEYVDAYDVNGEWTGQQTIAHSHTDISFSPDMIGGATIKLVPAKNVEINLLSKYVGKQYLDNTQNNARSLKGFFTEDVRCVYTIKAKWLKEINVIAAVNNIFNSMYVANGWTYPYFENGVLLNSNGYFPMAGTNFMFALNIKL